LKARDGKQYDRDVAKDVAQFKEEAIGLIVCLISDTELRSIGANVQAYEKACI